MQVVGETFQTLGLTLIQRAVPLGIIAHQRLGERWLHGLNMLREVVAIDKIKLVLPTFFYGGRRDGALLPGVAKNTNAILFINEDTRLLFGATRLLKSLVDDSLTLCDRQRLLDIDRFLPPKQPTDIRSAMIKR